ncbi:hypothetical protein PZA11_006352 [Diplocarpon coronariae]
MSGEPTMTGAPGAHLPNENRGPTILVVVTTITMIALVTVLLRVWVRIKFIRRVAASDYTMVFAMVLATTVWVLVMLQVNNGAGRHAAYIEPQVMKRGLRYNFASQPLTIVACTMPKVSVALFLLPIATRKIYRHFLWGLLAFMFVYTSVAVITTCLQCTDLRTFWDPLIPPTCWSPHARQTLSYIYTSLTIVTDFVLAFVPIPMLWNVQINIRVKLSLITIMSLGILLEINVGIIAGCLPCLKPLFRKILALTSLYASTSQQYADRRKGEAVHSLSVFKRSRAQQSTTSKRSNTTLSRALEDNNSEEGILPIQGLQGREEYKIRKTTVVTIDSVESGVNDERQQGLRSGLGTGWPRK